MFTPPKVLQVTKERTEKGAKKKFIIVILERGRKRVIDVLQFLWFPLREGEKKGVNYCDNSFEFNAPLQRRSMYNNKKCYPERFLKFSFFSLLAMGRKTGNNSARSGFAPVASRFYFLLTGKRKKIMRNVFWFHNSRCLTGV